MKGEIRTGRELTSNVELTCDVCVIGSGAGGAVLAAGLAQKGLSVALLEEGGYHTKADFDLEEAHAYPMLYQDRGSRATADLSITVLQGRCVGGSTTINWTTCFRTPERILAHWERVHGIEGLDAATLAPHFEAIEARLGIHEWPIELMNENNRVLWDGCKKLGYEVAPLKRNVRGCVNSGYCGLGCPVDAKQSMLITYVPDAIEHGARLFANVRAERIEVEAKKVRAVHGVVLDPDTQRETGTTVRVRAGLTVCAGGAINGPALLLRSGLNENKQVGRRTFLHPVSAAVARFERSIQPFYGAPQAVGSHHFAERGEGKVGFFFETAPLHPMLAATGTSFFGAEQHEFLSTLDRTNVILSLAIDGLLPGEQGGTVSLRGDGRPRLDYPIAPAMAEAFRAGTVELAKIQLAAGAQEVISLHTEPIRLRSDADLPALQRARYGTLAHSIFTAHQMGGCAMGRDPATSVVNANFRHHEIENLFVVDGSVCPTSLGVNPSETIYALAHLAVDRVAAAV